MVPLDHKLQNRVVDFCVQDLQLLLLDLLQDTLLLLLQLRDLLLLVFDLRLDQLRKLVVLLQLLSLLQAVLIRRQVRKRLHLELQLQLREKLDLVRLDLQRPDFYSFILPEAEHNILNAEIQHAGYS